MKELVIRKGRVEDLDGIAALEQVCFASPWSRESLCRDMTENQMAEYFVAELDNEVVGYLGIWLVSEEGYINNVAVSPFHRRQHVGSALIETMLEVTLKEGVRAHTLEVRASNEAAKGLYKKFGFNEAALRKGYYEDNGEDAIIMWRY